MARWLTGVLGNVASWPVDLSSNLAWEHISATERNVSGEPNQSLMIALCDSLIDTTWDMHTFVCLILEKASFRDKLTVSKVYLSPKSEGPCLATDWHSSLAGTPGWPAAAGEQSLNTLPLTVPWLAQADCWQRDTGMSAFQSPTCLHWLEEHGTWVIWRQEQTESKHH